MAAVSAAAFTIIPRHVLGGAGFTPPSDKINLAVIGLGRQGMVVMMNLLQLPEIQVVSVCDVNQGSKDYAEYDSNAMLTAARRLLCAGFENWATNSPAAPCGSSSGGAFSRARKTGSEV